MGLLARLATFLGKSPAPTEPFFSPSYRDRFVLNTTQAYDKTAVASMINAAHNGDTRLFSVFKQEMRAGDAHLDGEIRKVEAMLTQAPLEMLPYPPSSRRFSSANSPEAKKAQDIAAFCRDSLLDPDVDIGRAIRHLLWCLLDGAGGLQVIVQPGGGIGGKESLLALDPIPCERFRYLPGTTTLCVQPGDDQGTNALVPVGDLGASLVTVVADDHIPSPARRGILRRLVTPWVTKRYGFEWWGRDVELFGTPFRKGTYPSGDDARRAELEYALRTLGSAGYAAFPDGVDIEFISATGSLAKASSNPHQELIAFCDKATSKALTGSTQTSEIDPNAGSKASAGVHFDIVEKFVDSYGRQICAILRQQLVKPLVARNFGEDAARMFTPLPALRVKSYDDLGSFATALKTFGEAGFDEIPTAFVHERSGIPVPEEGEPTLEKPEAPEPLLPGGKPAPEDDPENELAAQRLAASMPAGPLKTIRQLDKAAKDMAPGTGDPIVAPYRKLIEETKADGGDLGHLAARVRHQAKLYNLGRQEVADTIAAVLAEATLRGFSETSKP